MFGRWGVWYGTTKSTQRCKADVSKIYELATSGSVTGLAQGEKEALDELTTLLGPLPREWIDSLGTQTHP